MRLLSKQNDNTNYILTVIDVFSRYAYALPIKNKTGDHITEAFKSIFKNKHLNYYKHIKERNLLIKRLKNSLINIKYTGLQLKT